MRTAKPIQGTTQPIALMIVRSLQKATKQRILFFPISSPRTLQENPGPVGKV
jgi:hypothetical protein